MKKFIHQIIILAICVIITGFGASLTMKASLGIGAYDAAAMSVSQLLIIKVGTVAMCFNISCVLFQVLILRKEFKPIQFLQIGISILLGTVVNFFLYSILGQLAVSTYILRLILFILGIIICAFAVAIIMAINIVSMPLEGFCMAISNKININFGKIRQYADVVSIVIAVILTLVFGSSLTLREGTILGMIMFGPLLDKFMNLFKPVLNKYDLI
ncbi:MAG: YitT family protein [Clostridiaceae bacterium]